MQQQMGRHRGGRRLVAPLTTGTQLVVQLVCRVIMRAVQRVEDRFLGALGQQVQVCANLRRSRPWSPRLLLRISIGSVRRPLTNCRTAGSPLVSSTSRGPNITSLCPNSTPMFSGAVLPKLELGSSEKMISGSTERADPARVCIPSESQPGNFFGQRCQIHR